jgi:hypothetical protein
MKIKRVVPFFIFLVGTAAICLPLFFAWNGPHSEIISFKMRELARCASLLQNLSQTYSQGSGKNSNRSGGHLHSANIWAHFSVWQRRWANAQLLPRLNRDRSRSGLVIARTCDDLRRF